MFAPGVLIGFPNMPLTRGLITFPGGIPSSAWSPGQLSGILPSVSVALQRSSGLLWQNTAKTTPATANNDPVRVATCPWTGVDYTARSDAARPLLQTDSTYWWLYFDGVDDRLDNNAVSTSGAATLVTGIANVRSSITPPVVDSVFATMGAGGNGIGVSTLNTFVNATQRQYVSENTGGAAATLRKNGGSALTSPNAGLNLSLNEVSTCTYEAASVAASTAARICGFTADNFFGNNRIYELILVGAALSTANRQLTEQYVAARCGVTLV